MAATRWLKLCRCRNLRTKINTQKVWLYRKLVQLTCRQQKLYAIYKDIVTRKDEALLLRLVEEGVIKPDQATDTGQTPLMVAVEA